MTNRVSNYGKIIVILAVVSIIAIVSGCLKVPENKSAEETVHNFTIYNYSTPGFEINQTQASIVWDKVKSSDDAMFVTSKRNYSVAVFLQSYTRLPAIDIPFDITTAEWIAVATSIPENSDDIKVAIFRLDYQTFDFKRSYVFSYPKGNELTRQQSIAMMEEELKKEPGGFQSIKENEVVLHEGNYIYSYLSPDIGETMNLFNWNEVPGKEDGRILYFLEREHHFDLPKDTKIEKIDNNRAIKVTGGGKTILLRLNDEKTRVNLKTDDGRTDELIAKMGDGKLNIYGATTDKGSTIIFNKYAGKIIFHATFVAGKNIWIKGGIGERVTGQDIGKEVTGEVIIPGEEINGTKLFPKIETHVEFLSSPAYRGTSTIAGLAFAAPDYVPNGTDILVDYRTGIQHTDGSMESEPEGFEIIPEKTELVLERTYLFSWDEIPGKDSEKLIKSLKGWYPLLDWLTTAKIEKIDNDKTIRVFNERDSILLKLNEEKTKIDLRTGIYAPHELIIDMDRNKLKIYELSNIYQKGNGRPVAYSNLTIKTSNSSVEGDYFITATVKYRSYVVGKKVLSFKIGKGGKKSGLESMTENTQNIGYSIDNPPQLSEMEKAEMTAMALDDSYLKGKMYKLISVTSEYLDIEDFSGFFAVATVDAGDPDYPGEIIRYIIDRDEKKVIKSTSTPRKSLTYFRGEAFDERNGNFTMKWDARNFQGFWSDSETNVSTETMVINQNTLNNGNRIIGKHNLIYTTRPVSQKYLVYVRVNKTPEGTDGFYTAVGWLGDKYVVLDGNRLAKIIFEQNASDAKMMTSGDSWAFEGGHKLLAQSIEAPLEKQAWLVFLNGTNKLEDRILEDRSLYSYPADSTDVPIFITYISSIRRGPYKEIGEFNYTWLRSQQITEPKEGDIFGIMEVTSINNGSTELRNKDSIDLAPGAVVNLMGNISIQVGSSDAYLSFHPFKTRKT